MGKVKVDTRKGRVEASFAQIREDTDGYRVGGYLRYPNTYTTSPRLLAYRGCIASKIGELKGKLEGKDLDSALTEYKAYADVIYKVASLGLIKDGKITPRGAVKIAFGIAAKKCKEELESGKLKEALMVGSAKAGK